ncbi:MAG: tetratricopeptide repeat protein [Acidobacteriota bacterium]
MDETDNTPDHLRELRARWQAERSSRILLQLADEYRREGRTEEAMEVLREGLAVHPNHLSAQVALGRTLLDLEQPQEASEAFEAILERDPTHLVANKLLVESRLRCGDADGATERLAQYRQLNGGDPEIPDLERRIETARSDATLSASSFDQEPFPDLFSGRDRSAYDAALGRDGLFAVPPSVAEPPQTVFEASPVAAPPAMPDSHEVSDSDAEAEPADRTPDEASAGAGEPEPTATLGQLFLEQGHRREATTIFERVLERDPESEAARSGLVEAAHGSDGEPGPDFARAADFLADGATGESSGERRIRLLKSYLQRIRRGGQSDVS